MIVSVNQLGDGQMVVKKKKDQLRSKALEEALDEVEQDAKNIGEDFFKDTAKQGHSREPEKVAKDQVKKQWTQINKDVSAVQRKRSEKAIGGVRGKFHSSKKGTGKTVSSKSIRRAEQKKQD